METRYFDDLKVGDTVKSISRTITETDLVNFISYMFQAEELFTSVEHALKRSAFKKRIVPGTLTLSLGLGLLSATGWNRDSALALLGIDEVRFLKPVVVGDSIYCEATVLTKNPRDAQRGVIVVAHTIRNQEEQAVVQFKTTRLIKSRHSGAT